MEGEKHGITQQRWPKEIPDPVHGAGGKRQQIRFSGFTLKDAKTLLNLVERLISSKAFGSGVDPHDVKILSTLPDKVHQRLVKHRLTEPRIKAPELEEKPALTLEAFLEDHIDHGRTSKGKPAAENTLQNWKSTRVFLNERFPGRSLNDINAEDAHQFRAWMDNRKISQKTVPQKGKPMTENAKRKHIANCKMFFNAAIRRGLVKTNPFAAQVSGSEANRSRDFFVTLEHTHRILNAAPDNQWRLLIALLATSWPSEDGSFRPEMAGRVVGSRKTAGATNKNQPYRRVRNAICAHQRRSALSRCCFYRG